MTYKEENQIEMTAGCTNRLTDQNLSKSAILLTHKCYNYYI